MIRATARYRDKVLELDHPLDLDEGARVVIDVSLETGAAESEAAWSDLGMSRLEEEWNNPEDAIYDDWRTLYGVRSR